MIGSCKIKDLLLQIFPSKGRESSGKEASAQEMGFRKGSTGACSSKYWNIEFNDIIKQPIDQFIPILSSFS